MYHKRCYDTLYGQKPKSFLNALDALTSIPDYGRLIADVSPALEFVRQHEEMIRRLTSNPAIDAMRQQEESLRQLTSPILKAVGQQEEMTRQLLHNPLLLRRCGPGRHSQAVHGDADRL
jgi:hypothetical protein